MTHHKTKIYAIALVALFAVFSCKEKEQTKETALHGTITFLKGEVHVNDTQARLGLKVKESDVIQVNDKSMTVIQFMNNAQVTIEEGTNIAVARIFKDSDGAPSIDLEQKNGSTFHKIMPGKANYRLRTPTITAGVRGTSFRVDLRETGQTKVKLLRGKVAVKKQAEEDDPKAAEVILQPGEKLHSTDEEIGTPEKLEENEIDELTAMNSIAYVPPQKLQELEEADVSEIEEIMQGMPEVVPPSVEKIIIPGGKNAETKDELKSETKKPEKTLLTLKQLREQYGELTKITTQDGTVYIGSFKQQGDQFEIETVKGKITIPSTEVVDVAKYEGE